MIYVCSITTPANTIQGEPLVSRLKVVAGVVYQIEVEFPPGPYGFLYCQIFHNSVLIWPSSPGESFRSDNLVISFPDTYLIRDEPLEFVVKTWNLDDTYTHWLQVRIGLVSDEAYISRYLPGVAYKEAVDALQLLYEQQEVERQSILESPYTWPEV